MDAATSATAEISQAVERTAELYDELAASITRMKKKALANLVYEEDFERDPANSKRFRLKSGDGSLKSFETFIFGEIIRSGLGTVHQASGNHYAGRGPPVSILLF